MVGVFCGGEDRALEFTELHPQISSTDGKQYVDDFPSPFQQHLHCLYCHSGSVWYLSPLL